MCTSIVCSYQMHLMQLFKNVNGTSRHQSHTENGSSFTNNLNGGRCSGAYLRCKGERYLRDAWRVLQTDRSACVCPHISLHTDGCGPALSSLRGAAGPQGLVRSPQY